VGGSEKESDFVPVALKRTGCLQQMFKMMPLRLHMCSTQSIDQRPCWWCSAECLIRCFKSLMS